MTAIVLQARPESMATYNPLDMDDVQTPASDYSYTQANFMSSNTSGMFPFSHTGPGDLNGSWDATVEGSQNFQDYSDHGSVHQDQEDYSFTYGHSTPRKDQESLDDLQNKWAATSVADASMPSAEPMRRIASKSSVGSHKHRTIRASSSNKKRPRLQSAISQASSQLSSYDMTGNAAFPDGPLPTGHMMDVNQYPMLDTDALSVSPLQYGMMSGMPDGLPYLGMGSTLTQHVNPTCTQVHMDFEPSLAGTSPHSWDSSSTGSGRSSPGPMAHSPTESDGSSSPFDHERSPRNTHKYGSQMMAEDLGGHLLPASMMDDYALAPAFGSRRHSNEGESARDHPLYKQVAPQADGLFHCPWEGQASCNHKPEKLKCNYDKFVDSHLKPYRCKHDSCENARFSSTACLLRHEREAHAMHGHGDKPFLCTYEGCDRALPGNGFPRQWNLKDHMRRVHHDNGSSLQMSAAASPPPSGSSQSKSRRKKKDTMDSTSSRKSSLKSKSGADSSAASRMVDSAQNAYNEWYEHQKALSGLASGFSLDDPSLLQNIQDAQAHLAAISKISPDLVSNQKGDILSSPYIRSFPQQSG